MVAPPSLARARIGYATFSRDYSWPAYRRRFGYYAKTRELTLIPADARETYDAVVVHHSADLTVWRDYSKAPIVFDYNDSYLQEEPWSGKRLLRGLAKYALRQTDRLAFLYSQCYEETMRRAAVTVCASAKQADDARRFCRNVVEIVDFWADGPLRPKEVYSCSVPFRMVWEGFPAFDGFEQLRKPLGSISAGSALELHVFSKLESGKYLNGLWRQPTKSLVAAHVALEAVFLYEWNAFAFASLGTLCDLAIIPLNTETGLVREKPGNKLLQFWRLGMPVLASSTAEYTRLARLAGIDCICNGSEEWGEKLSRVIADKEVRETLGRGGRAFAEKDCGEEMLLKKWDEVLCLVL